MIDIIHILVIIIFLFHSSQIVIKRLIEEFPKILKGLKLNVKKYHLLKRAQFESNLTLILLKISTLLTRSDLFLAQIDLKLFLFLTYDSTKKKKIPKFFPENL